MSLSPDDLWYWGFFILGIVSAQVSALGFSMK